MRSATSDFVARVARRGREGARLHRARREAVARYLFKLMAYKDEYEVARLYTDGAFLKRVASSSKATTRCKFHLAPPLLAKTDPATGEPAQEDLRPVDAAAPSACWRS